jgi:hypothetical protein
VRSLRTSVAGVFAAAVLAGAAVPPPTPAAGSPTFGAGLSQCHWSNGQLFGDLFAWVTDGVANTEYSYSIWSDFAQTWVPQGRLGTTNAQGFLSRLLVPNLTEQSLPWRMQAWAPGSFLPETTVRWTCLPKDADPTPPDVVLNSPANGATFARDSLVTVHYVCSDPGAGASGIAACTAPLADGALLDTSRLGPQEFTVEARDRADNRRAVTHLYTVVPAEPPPARPAPEPLPSPAPMPAVTAPGRAPSPFRIVVLCDFETGPLRHGWVRVERLRLTRVPPGVTVSIACRGGGCRKRTARFPGKPRMELARRLRRLRPPTAIEIRVTRPGAIGYVLRLHVQRRGDTRSGTMCLPPGTGRPRSHC